MNLLCLLPCYPRHPCGCPQQDSRTRGNPWSREQPTEPTVVWMGPWEAGGWWQLSPLSTQGMAGGCQEARKGHQVGRAPLMPWVWGVLAKPRGGVKVGSSDPAPGSAWLLVQLCIPSVCLITSTGGSQQALGVWDDP